MDETEIEESGPTVYNSENRAVEGNGPEPGLLSQSFHTKTGYDYYNGSPRSSVSSIGSSSSIHDDKDTDDQTGKVIFIC